MPHFLETSLAAFLHGVYYYSVNLYSTEWANVVIVCDEYSINKAHTCPRHRLGSNSWEDRPPSRTSPRAHRMSHRNRRRLRARCDAGWLPCLRDDRLRASAPPVENNTFQTTCIFTLYIYFQFNKHPVTLAARRRRSRQITLKTWY